MATQQHSALVGWPVADVRRQATWISTASVALSIALVVDTLAASVATLWFRDALRGPEVSIGSLQGTAVVLLLVTLPTLAASMVLAWRGSAAAVIGWLGALGSIAYQAVLFLFGTPFNAFFFLYVAMLSLAIWSLVALIASLPIEQIGREVGRRAPVRLIAGYLILNAVLFLALWLRATVPAVLSEGSPAFLEGTGMTTGPGQIIDLGFTLPLLFLAAALLLRRRPVGRLLTGAMLVMLAIGTASIGVDQWMGHAADPTSTVASAALTPVFAVITALGVGILVLFVRGTEPAAADPGPR